MALLEWNNLNKSVRIQDTRKKYFSKYYASVKYKLVGGRIITQPGTDYDIDAAVDHRRVEQERVFNYGGSWFSRRDPLANVDVAQLEAMRWVKNSHPNMFFRIEEPYITMYAETEDELFQLATTALKDWQDKLVNVTRPASPEHKELLDKGVIIMKTDLNYRYKVIFKDGRVNNKEGLHNYLRSLEDNVKVSRSVWHNLSNSHNWLWGVWFYINDPDLTTMFNIIEPGIVSNIHEVVII